MALSDELKSLSEQVKKMTTTIAKLILARTPHGTSSADENIFDRLSNGLPRNMKMEQIAEFALTSKVILSYKIDYLNSFHDQLMKGLWKRSSNGCIYPLDNCYEKILYVEINEDYKVDSEKLMEELRNFSVTRQVFDKVSEPNPSLSNNQTVSYTVKNAQKLKNGGIQADDNEICVSDSCILQEREVVSGVEQVFDEIPEPHFYPYQVQMTSINGEDTQNPTEVESIKGDHELEPAIQKVQSDHFTHKQLCAKLCTLEGSHLWDLVIIYANKMRFSTILKSLFNGCQLSDKMPHKVDDSYGNSYSECPCFEVSAKSFVMLNADYSSKFIENVVSPLLLSDIDWFIGSSISMILGVNVYKSKVFELEHDWRSQSNFKEVNSWDKPSIWNDYGMLEITSGLLYSGGQFMILKSLYILLIICGSISVGFSLINGTQVAMFEHSVNLCPIWICAPYDPGILRRALLFPYTLEDKGNFRGEEDKLFVKYTCQLFSVPVFHHNHISSGINKSDTFLISIFNPSGLSWLCELRGDHLHKFSSLSVLVLAPFVDKVVIFVLNEQGSYTKWLLPFLFLSYSRNVIEFLCLIVTLTLGKNGEHKRDGVHNLSSHSEAGTVCFKEYIKSEYFILGLGNVLNHINVKMWCHVRLGKSSLWSIFFLYSNFNGFLIKNFIWDPGIIDKIAYEQFRTSNVSRVGCRKDIILLTLWLMKYLAASSRISDVGAIGFVNFDSFASSMISNARALGPDNFKYV